MFSKKFYPIKDLLKDGFIHSDGSVRFEYYVKRSNFFKKLTEESKIADEAHASIISDMQKINAKLINDLFKNHNLASF